MQQSFLHPAHELRRGAVLPSTTSTPVRMTGTRVAKAAWLCLFVVIAQGQVAAEPLTAGSGSLPAAMSAPEPEGQAPRAGVIDPPKVGAPGVIDRALVGNEAPNSSKTVELLLEMQGKNPGLEGGERPKAEVKPSRPTAADTAKPAFAGDPASPFGSAETLRAKPASGDPEAIDWSEAPASRLGGGGLAAGGSLSTGGGAQREPFRPTTQSARSTDEDDVIWLIPRKLVRFVRENRDMVVLGSVGLLLLLWGVSSLTAGRRQ